MAEHAAVLTTAPLAGQFRRALVCTEDIRLAFIKVLNLFDKTPAFQPGISGAAQVDASARIAPSAAVLPGAVVMANAVIGPGCVLYPGVVVEPYAEVGEGTLLYPCAVVGHHCVVGRHCIIYGGAVIGADGFGYYDRPGQRHKIPQIGNVVISDHVEIGAGCTIDRATIESTTVGTYTKIDDQVHIGHNCRIGRYIYIIGNSAIGGSVVIEDGAMISGMVIVKDHVRVAKGSGVMGMSGLAQDTEPGQAYFGTPALPAREAHKMHAALRRLPELIAKVRKLEEQLLAAKGSGV
jgi:UDP-3-O-[3-hydroxymyristoyl] glucosamine N-acyltransferase